MSSVLGETAVVIGNVDGTGDLEIRGRVQGSLTLSGRVFVAESGVVLGNIEATNITVAGEVRGDLAADDGVEVHALGRVEGNIEAPRVGIEAGARVRGMLRTGGELPAPEKKKRDPERSQKRPAKKRDPEPSKLRGDGPSTPPPRQKIAPPKDEPAPSPPAPREDQVRDKGKRARRRKGPPTPPTFVKGAKGHSK